MIRTYYLLTKPGIILGNAMTTAAAFLMASRQSFDFPLFLATVSGLFCIIASACVCNNAIDREADQKMERTKHRALARGEISLRAALIFAACLGVLGLLILSFFTNRWALSVALLGFFVYVVLYSFWKYHTEYATLVGSIAGAIPPVVGYCSAAQTLDWGAILLFLLLVLWQMPHFYAIALYRIEDYAAASIPVLPLARGSKVAKVQMMGYTAAFALVAPLLTSFGYTGQIYLGSTLLLGLCWVVLSWQGLKAKDEALWAKRMFRFSLIVISCLSFLIAWDAPSLPVSR